MKLLFVNDNAFEKIGQDYYSVFSWPRFPQLLSDYCDQITLWSPVRKQSNGATPDPESWKVQQGSLRIAHFDYFFGFKDFYRLLPKKIFIWQKHANELARCHDAIVIRTPSPILPIIAKAARHHHKPLIMLVVGDLWGASDRMREHRGLTRFIYALATKFFVRQEIQHGRQSKLIYVHSAELARRHSRSKGTVKFMRTPHISMKDFFYRQDTCQAKLVRLLRVSWLQPSKGLECLIEATALLLNKGISVKLDIVGREQQIHHYKARLEALAEQLGVKDKIVFSGWVPFDQLQAVYIRSDIQVVSSLNEGVPRCIVEGAAHGLPLVSTTAGGCVDWLTCGENALLVPPGDPKAMADAIERVIREPALRQKLIREGYELARSSSFENLGLEFLAEIRKVVHED